jgi:hypothetical protein
VEPPASEKLISKAGSRGAAQRGPARPRRGALLLLGLGLVGGCSDAAGFGTERQRPDDGSINPSSTSSDPSSPGAPSMTSPPAPETWPSPTIDQVGDHFEEESCPDVPRLHRPLCDPLAEQNECAEGQGCYPYVEYPTSRCEPETFGTRCDTAGVGVQGHACAGERCAPGFLCVVTGRGTECAHLCRMPGPNTCPDGFICGSLDIDGYGVCI